MGVNEGGKGLAKASMPADTNGTAHQRWPSRVLLGVAQVRLRSQVAQTLLDEGYEIAEASTGVQTLDYLRVVIQCRLRLPDVIVLSSWMEDCPAVEIARAIRRAAWPTPIVLLGEVEPAMLHELGDARALPTHAPIAEVRDAVLEAHVQRAAAHAS